MTNSLFYHVLCVLGIHVALYHVGSCQTTSSADCESCPNELFCCQSGECISKHLVCNEVQDCVDNSDASDDCLTSRFGISDDKSCGKHFKCSKGRQCITDILVCDGNRDCRDGSDETERACSTRFGQGCPRYAFRCDSGACIDKKFLCNGVNDCKDGSDELGPLCRSQPKVKTCRKDEFRCKSGECIKITSVCNGVSDCSDASDEDQCTIRNRCEGFVCDDGACIHSNMQCDGNKDCLDGSDEIISNCQPPQTNIQSFEWLTSLISAAAKASTTSKPCGGFICENGDCLNAEKVCDGSTDCRDGSDEREDNCKRLSTQIISQSPNTPILRDCRLPKQPVSGRYKLTRCGLQGKCDVIPGKPVSDGSILEFTCFPGYFLSGVQNTPIALCYNGTWSASPECLKNCEKLESSSVDIQCFSKGESVSCNQSLPPESKVTVRCKPLHHNSNPSSGFSEMKCMANGKWERNLFTCVPDCGRSSKTNVRPLISYGYEVSQVSEFPWHVGVYKKNSSPTYTLQCGGTLISARAILSAAHCFYNPVQKAVTSPDLFKVSVGKYRQGWQILDPEDQRRDVGRIIIHTNYRDVNSNYSPDIAMLEAKEDFILNHYSLPVCIERSASLPLTSFSLLTAVGWGQTEQKKPSEELRQANLPIVDYDTCTSALPDITRFITYDKFCAGYTNGTGVSVGDSGGGMVFLNPQTGLYYLAGIVSIKSKVYEDSYAVFTNISAYVGWVDSVLTEINQAQ